jgi:hypothetical protein
MATHFFKGTGLDLVAQLGQGLLRRLSASPVWGLIPGADGRFGVAGEEQRCSAMGAYVERAMRLLAYRATLERDMHVALQAVLSRATSSSHNAHDSRLYKVISEFGFEQAGRRSFQADFVVARWKAGRQEVEGVAVLELKRDKPEAAARQARLYGALLSGMAVPAKSEDRDRVVEGFVQSRQGVSEGTVPVAMYTVNMVDRAVVVEAAGLLFGGAAAVAGCFSNNA